MQHNRRRRLLVPVPPSLSCFGKEKKSEDAKRRETS
jgi:hypothetical protein